MTDIEDIVIQRAEYPTRLVANTYLVVGIAILLLSSMIETSTLSRYLIGTLVEFLLAALALIALRLEKLSVKKTARLSWPAAQEILLAVAAAPGLWITGVMLNLVSVFVLGYVTPVPPSQFPTTIAEAAALMLATLVAAPLCEELIFRGYVQRAYERKRVWVGVLAGGFIFALYHLRFQGVAAIIPVALALSFIAWRTGSLIPGIALHAAYNAIATILLVSTSFLPMQVTGALTGTIACLSVLMTPLSLVALFLLWKRTWPSPHRPVPQPKVWLRWAWILPLVGLSVIYGYSAVSEVLIGRFPETVFNDPLKLEAPPASWDGLTHWRYTIQNQLGDELGEATCSRRQEDSRYTLSCEAEHEGYDLSNRFPFLEGWQPLVPSDGDTQAAPPWWPAGLPRLESLVRTEPQAWTLSAVWDSPDLAVQAFTMTTEAQEAGQTTMSYERAPESPDIEVTTPTGSSAVALPTEPALMAFEWVWRLSALPFEVGYGGDATLVALQNDTGAKAYEAFVQVRGGEPAWTPAGTFVAWKVVVSWEDGAGRKKTQTAWYDAQPPHTLVRFDDGVVSYVLATVDTADQVVETEAYAVLLRGRK
ncbi:MAG: CPBP family intramembrane metalloprotease [Anaerolineae bacterium]|nr:CPBP family intramembrane metalloprotease [Anaerolineae bacterium]